MIYSNSIIKAKDIVPLNTNELDPNIREIINILLRDFCRDEIIDMYGIYNYKNVIEKYPKLLENLKDIKETEYDFDFSFALLHAHTNVSFRNIHYKMVVTQLCTILDECLANIIKAIGMYYSDIIKNRNI